ncbi:MAG: nucleotidyltransferase domain-containing protein [Promethearchaeota archaeon]
MNKIEGIEGDYIETIENNLFFDVKGLLHPTDYYICFLRFFPHSDGDRKKNGIQFKKVYKLNERYAILRKMYPSYLFYSKELDLEVQGVKKEEIKKIYTPRNFLKTLLEKIKLSHNEKYSIDLCKLFINKGNLSERSIGITGSTMVGLDIKNSDIDIVIYGTETSLVFQEKLAEIFKKSKTFRKYNIKEYKAHYEWRAGGSNIPFKDFLKIEQRKQHQGKFMNRDFFIRYIKSPKDWKGNFYDYQYNNSGRIKLKAEVIDSKDSIFTPCSYQINPLKILESTIDLKDTNIRDINEISSFRGRYCEHVKDGELIFVEGKLEKVIYKNKFNHYRVLLTDQIKDKILILN